MSKKYNIDKLTVEYGKSKMAQTKKNANTKSSAKSKTKVRAKETQNTEPKKNTGAASEIIGVVLICVGVLFGIAAYTSISALLIKWIKHLTFGLFGVMGYFAPVAIAAVGVLFIIYGKRSKKAFKVLMSVLGVLSVLGIIHICFIGKLDFTDKTYFDFLSHSYKSGYSQIIGAGFFGALLSFPLYKILDVAGTICIFSGVLIISVILVFNFSLRKTGAKAAEKIREKNRLHREREAVLREEQERELREYHETHKDVPENKEYACEDHYAARTYEDDDYDHVHKHIKKKKKKRRSIMLADMEILHKNAEQDNEYGDEITDEDAYYEKQYNEIYGKEPVYKVYTEQDKNSGYYTPVHSEQTEQPKENRKPEKLTIIGQDLTGALAKKQSPLKTADVEVYDMGHASEPVYEEPVYEDVSEDAAEEPVYEFEEPHIPEMKKRAPVVSSAKKTNEKGQYKFPPIDLLDQSQNNISSRSSQAETRLYSEKLESTLSSFGVSAKVVNTERGPKVTRYELQPAPGVKISKIVNLADDIALNLAAESVRIEAPIPGKAAIGIELPNKEAVSVVARDLIDTAEFRSQKSTLSFALGKDIMGRNVYADLSKMPHLLVAGTTGSGKSVCLNMIILSLLYRTSPDQVKLMLIDPKRGVEMAKYNDIPNLITPVVTEPAKAAGALTWAVSEMINRYKALNSTGSRNIERHNEILIERGEEPVPKLVIVIDEFADLMMVSSKEVEDAVCRIAQLGRASGIHLVIATQSPRADIFTGLIKANVPSRIALTVGNSLESRIIMDSTGAETLLGAGDMLFRPIGVNKPTRIQGCWISDREIEGVADFLKNSCDAQYDSNLESQIEKLAEQSGRKDKKSADIDGNDAGFEDDLTKKAIKIALDYDGVSASMLQRRLRVGYARASRLVDELESLGIVGPADGSKPRQLLITHEDYMRLYGTADEEILEEFDD
ncbi:MAG: DNA translocase FtsK [Christensenellaceae bacterium]|nr:DNA translocase FtsK [Christensenellaceae bacterium]